MDILKRKLDLRLDIYFSMTTRQQRAFNAKYSWQFLEHVTVAQLSRYTKNKVTLAKLVELRRLSIRAIEAA